MSNMKNTIAQIATLNTVEEVAASMEAEMKNEYPRKGVLEACERRMGQLCLELYYNQDRVEAMLAEINKKEDEMNSDNNPEWPVAQDTYVLPEDEDTEEVEKNNADIKKFLSWLGLQRPVSQQTLDELNVVRISRTDGKAQYNFWVNISYYHNNRERMYELNKLIGALARNKGWSTKFRGLPGQQGYLEITK